MTLGNYEKAGKGKIDFMQLIGSNALDWGKSDILAAGSDPNMKRLGEIAAYFTILGDKDGNRKADAVWVILPPLFETDPDAVIQELSNNFAATLVRISDGEIGADGIADNFRFVTPISTVSFDGDALVELLRQVPPKTGIIIWEAKNYRMAATQNTSLVEIAEDVWSKHVHQLIVEIDELCTRNNCYTLLDLGSNLPSRQKNKDLLFSVGDVGVMATDTPVEDADSVITRVKHWYEAAEAGKIGAVIREVEEDQELSEIVRLVTKLELLSIGKFFAEIQVLLRANEKLLEGLSFENLLHVARIAETANADDFSEKLIRKATPFIRSETGFEVAFSTVIDSGRKNLIDMVRSSFKRLYPYSDVLRRDEANQASQGVEYILASEIFGKLPKKEDALRSKYFALLAKETSGTSWAPAIAFTSLISEMAEVDDAVVVDLARTLEHQDRRIEALEFLLQRGTDLSSHQLNCLTRLVERALQSGEILSSDQSIEETLNLILAHIGCNPSDGALRVRLAALLDPSIMGGTGYATLVVAVLKRASIPPHIRERPKLSDRPSPINIEEVMPRFKKIMKWLEIKGYGRLIVGQHTLPADQLDVPADQFISALLNLVDHHGAMIKDDDDEKVLQMYALVACAVAPLSSEPDEDLTILRTVGSRLASSGRAQSARDIAEQALTLAGDGAERHRQALFTFADIYARLGMRTEALIAFGSAYEASKSATWDQVWFESNLLFRLLRDTGMSELGIPLLNLSRQALDALGILERDEYRINMFEIQAMTSAFDSKGGDVNDLIKLLQMAQENALAVMDHNDDPLPISTILSSLLCLAAEMGFTETSDVEDLIEKLIAKLPASKKALVRAAGPQPTLENIADVASSISAARYVEDTGYDIRHVRIMARRLVQQAIQDVDPTSLIYAIEASTDRAISVMSVYGERVPAERLLDKGDRPRIAAENISKEGLAIFGMALLDNQIATIEFEKGKVSDISFEPEKVFSASALDKWSNCYPRNYMQEDQNLSQDMMAASVAGLGLTKLPKKSIFISDARLGRFPPNLLTINGTYAGFLHAIASAPSLEWLGAARTLDRKGKGDARMWIPASKTEEDTAPLTLMSNDVCDVLDANQIPLEISHQPSREFGKADIAIIGAHGGLAETNRYFRSISDDSHLLKSISDVTSLTKSARLTILFVCSAGRVDPHPETGMAVGLARQFLVRGSSAVIAPAWPIPFFIARPWLQGFFKEWNSGSILLDAYHAGNLSVAKSTSWDPKRTLAMTLYGDPFIRISS